MILWFRYIYFRFAVAEFSFPPLVLPHQDLSMYCLHFPTVDHHGFETHTGVVLFSLAGWLLAWERDELEADDLPAVSVPRSHVACGLSTAACP